MLCPRVDTDKAALIPGFLRGLGVKYFVFLQFPIVTLDFPHVKKAKISFTSQS